MNLLKKQKPVDDCVDKELVDDSKMFMEVAVPRQINLDASRVQSDIGNGGASQYDGRDMNILTGFQARLIVILGFCICCLCAILAGIIGAFVGATVFPKEDTTPIAMLSSPTFSPSIRSIGQPPSQQQQQRGDAGKQQFLVPTEGPTVPIPPLLKLLRGNAVGDDLAAQQRIETSNTPQNRAYLWLQKQLDEQGIDLFFESGSDKVLQRYALGTLYYSTRGPVWNDNTNWLSYTDECSWAVDVLQCDGSNSAVTSLELVNNGLIGYLPPEIGLMTSLTNLVVNHNRLDDEALPAELGMLSSIVNLDLFNNSIPGPIPTEIGQLRTALGLFLGYNEFTGTLPTQLGYLTSIQNGLGLQYNQFSGPIPTELGRMTLMKQMLLQGNELTGNVPTFFSAWDAVTSFDVSRNDLTGSVPDVVCDHFNALGTEVFDFTADCPDEIVCPCCTRCCRDSNTRSCRAQ